MPRFERVLKALPQDKLDYRPHGRSKSAKEIVFAMAGEATTYSIFLKTGLLDFAMTEGGGPNFGSVNEAFAAFLKGHADAKELATGMSESDWNSEAKMTAGPKEIWKTTKGGMAWGLILDLIHHRGQLSSYIRPMGGKVPSIYGPSGDAEG